ncbi:hypothetical protein FDP22_23080 (plasmid) [Paroceanicella profunda]|uniref:Uncharacterized protein n=1 Tax=Paroceanicella profunda TaxID=2579971 RepID=A0A5B8G5L6_9RHOB|nr:hypothetical protein [Paroceanicella profunda]QDL94759.1 hypothetical protein FDP22_23080 [Paroceanicella profunda]
MALIADGLMIVASLVAAIYCIVLSSRVRGLTNLDQGLGAAIAGLSRQVDGMQGALEQAKRASGASVRELREMTARAESAAGRLELLLAALHTDDAARPIPSDLRATARAAAAAAPVTAPAETAPPVAAAPPPMEEAPAASWQAEPGRPAGAFSGDPGPDPEPDAEPEPDVAADVGPPPAPLAEEEPSPPAPLAAEMADALPEPEIAPEPEPEPEPEILPDPPGGERPAPASKTSDRMEESEEGELALAPPPPRPAPGSPAAESLRTALRDLLGRRET